MNATTLGDTHIRPCRPSDREQVVQLWRGVFPNPLPHNNPERDFDRKLAQADDLFFVAAIDETIVGTAMAGYDGHRGWVYLVAVHPQFRRRGIGRAMIAQVEAALRSRGCPKANLQVRASNDAAVEFYRRSGYDVEPHTSMGKLLG